MHVGFLPTQAISLMLPNTASSNSKAMALSCLLSQCQLLEAFLVRDSRALHKQLHKIRPNAQLMGAAHLLELVDSASKASHAQNYIELERCVFRMREEAAVLAANLKRV